MYVWGSLATNSYIDGLSDIDVLVILQSDVSEEVFSQLKTLASILIKEEESAEKLDATFVTVENVNRGDGTASQGGIEFWKGTLQKIENSLGDNPLVLDMVRKTSLCLYGSDAAAVINPVSRERVVNALKKELRELRDGMAQHFNDLGWRYYTITTLCRVLYTFTTTDYLSKRDALLWYQSTYHENQSLIRAALAYVEGDDSLIERIQPEDLLSFIYEVEKVV